MWLENPTLVFFSLFQEQILPPRPEAYPIPTQTYTREYFTFPASKSQDRMGPAQSQWPSYEEKPQLQAESNNSINTTMQVRSNFFSVWGNKSEGSCLLSIPGLLETFFRIVSSLQLYHEMGTTVLLPRWVWVQEPYGLGFFPSHFAFFSPPFLSQNLLPCSADLLSGIF